MPDYPLRCRTPDMSDDQYAECRLLGPGNVPGQVRVAVHTEFGTEITLWMEEKDVWTKPKGSADGRDREEAC
jgi:hypothetical protein